MTFHPKMQSHVHGVKVLKDLSWRAWPGVLADVWDVECDAGAHGNYVSRAPRLFVLLETDNRASIELTIRPGSTNRVTLGPDNPMCFIPAGVPLWSSMAKRGRLKHLDLHLDVSVLSDRFRDRLDLSALEATQLTFQDERVITLARLIAMECCSPSSLDELYSDSLVTALIAVLGNIARVPETGSSGLSPRLLKKVLAYMDENCTRNISLQELARLANLSPSYFSHAFKKSTGLPPHRWQMGRRVEVAKSLLTDRQSSLTDAAIAAGFSDQSHLTRVFRQFEGTTPAAWQRQHSH
ncbi:helix-turn-helix domain-containing protein [Roseibium sp.]|uniref:AraC family transcriptional regulator n=1 Tax=Roseibium sp. TaxID=1936156 RepID=UPI003A98541F